jgi:hypothetical protein
MTLYNGQNFPEYIFTDKVKSCLFVDFDMIFMNQGFWQIMKSYLESANIHKIVIKNLNPDYHFIEEMDVAELPKAFMKLVLTENLEGYFSSSATLHMITIQTLIYPLDDEDVFCILADRDYSVGIIGFSNPRKPEMFGDYEIIDVLDYLRLTFAGKDLPSTFKKEVIENWKLPPLQS